jgi:hypothetical protein
MSQGKRFLSGKAESGSGSWAHFMLRHARSARPDATVGYICRFECGAAAGGAALLGAVPDYQIGEWASIGLAVTIDATQDGWRRGADGW